MSDVTAKNVLVERLFGAGIGAMDTCTWASDSGCTGRWRRPVI